MLIDDFLLDTHEENPSGRLAILSRILCGYLSYKHDNVDIGTFQCEEALISLLSDVKLAADRLGVDFNSMAETASEMNRNIGVGAMPAPARLQ